MAQPTGALAGTTLHQLFSDDEARLLDTIDGLRSQGVGKLLGEAGLPQLIVCGDQSSGKSSVLEALTRVRFPTKSSVCTTFPTELRLRREPRSQISCRIKAAASRSPEEKERLARFQESFESPERFPDLITAARNYMSESAQGNTTVFFDDILEVEIVGPKLAPLTIVDLPGLIHYRSTSSGDRDIELVSSLVQSYMKQSNSIILAVVSAHNDINNQIVLRHIKNIVPDGNRTLGIITKPDELPPGSEKEQEYLDYARTNPSKFQYGWHIVRNRSYEEQSSSFEERDEKEMAFFRASNWNPLPRREVGLGIDSLRQKLSKMLLEHISLSLPSIMQRLEVDLEQSEGELERLGEIRSTPKDQQKYLSDISDNFSDYTKDALDGRYHRMSFFGDPLSPEGLEKRLRANVRHLNDEFANAMLKQGHKWHIVEDSEMPSMVFRSQNLDHPNVIAKSAFLKNHVDALAYHERANELQGMSNPLLVGSLFHQQSEPWESIASAHLDAVWKAVKEFLEHLLSHLADEKTCNQLLIHIIDPAMEKRRQTVKAKLEELLVPHRDYDPINADPHFARRIWSLKQSRVARSIVKIVQQEWKGGDDSKSFPSVDEIMTKITTPDTQIDDKYGSHETLEFMQAYYETTILIFMNNVASLGVEQCLLTGLPKIFSSATIRDMNDERLELIASESRDTLSERERLTERVKVLQNGLQAIKLIHPGTRATRHTARTTQKSQSTLPFTDFEDQTAKLNRLPNKIGTSQESSEAHTVAPSVRKSHNQKPRTSSSQGDKRTTLFSSPTLGIAPPSNTLSTSSKPGSVSTNEDAPSLISPLPIRTSGSKSPEDKVKSVFNTSNKASGNLSSSSTASSNIFDSGQKRPLSNSSTPFSFSDPVETTTTPKPSSNGFNPTTSLFGSSGQAVSTGGSPFGISNQTTGGSLFGTPSLFGVSKQAAPTARSNLFGSPQLELPSTSLGAAGNGENNSKSKCKDDSLPLLFELVDPTKPTGQMQILRSHLSRNMSWEEIRAEDYANDCRWGP